MKFNLSRRAGITLSIAASLFVYQMALGAGYEKSILWSGHYAGLAGAGTSIVSGPEALFFNPAALVGAGEGCQATVNLTPTLTQFSAPIGMNRSQLGSDRSLTLPGSVFVRYEMNPKLGLGLGYYASGGSKAIFNDVNFSYLAFNGLTPSFKSDLSITELSAGAGYEVSEGFRIGAAYRVVFVNGNLSTATIASLPVLGSTLVATTLNNLSDSNFSGFRFGAQYSPKDQPWGLGLQLRTAIGFNAKGTASGALLPATVNTSTPLTGGNVTVSNQLPTQLSLGGYYDIVPDSWRAIAEYSFTQYNSNQSLGISGDNLRTPTGSVIPLASINQGWTNQNQLRLAAEYKMLPSWSFRGGYVFTSQVVPKTTAKPTFSSPGSGHTVALGVGTLILPRLTANIAAEYSWAAGSVSASENLFYGDYSSNAVAAHVGLTYTM